MNHYEILAIASGRFADTEIAEVISKIEEILKKYECTLHYTQNLERRKLAYPIKHQAYGTYFLAEFDCAVTKMSGLDRELRLTQELLRHIIVRRDTVGVPRPLFKEHVIEERVVPRRQQREKTLEQALETVEKETAAAHAGVAAEQTETISTQTSVRQEETDSAAESKKVKPQATENGPEEKLAKNDEGFEKELDKKLEEILRDGI